MIAIRARCTPTATNLLRIDKLTVDVDVRHLVDQHADAQPGGALQQVLHQGGLAGAQKPGDHHRRHDCAFVAPEGGGGGGGVGGV